MCLYARKSENPENQELSISNALRVPLSGYLEIQKIQKVVWRSDWQTADARNGTHVTAMLVVALCLACSSKRGGHLLRQVADHSRTAENPALDFPPPRCLDGAGERRNGQEQGECWHWLPHHVGASACLVCRLGTEEQHTAAPSRDFEPRQRVAPEVLAQASRAGSPTDQFVNPQDNCTGQPASRSECELGGPLGARRWNGHRRAGRGRQLAPDRTPGSNGLGFGPPSQIAAGRPRAGRCRAPRCTCSSAAGCDPNAFSACRRGFGLILRRPCPRTLCGPLRLPVRLDAQRPCLRRTERLQQAGRSQARLLRLIVRPAERSRESHKEIPLFGWRVALAATPPEPRMRTSSLTIRMCVPGGPNGYKLSSCNRDSRHRKSQSEAPIDKERKLEGAQDKIELLIEEGNNFDYSNFSKKGEYGYPSSYTTAWVSWCARVEGAVRRLLSTDSSAAEMIEYAKKISLIGNGSDKFNIVHSYYLGALDVVRKIIADDIFGEIPSEKAIAPLSSSRRVFIVHGHDEKSKNELEIILHEMGLDPIVLHRQADSGKTLIEKFEHYSDVGFAFIIMTPDEVAYLSSDAPKDDASRQKEQRPRPNVVFEFGYFVGRLGRNRTCCLIKGEVARPSDIDGLLYKKFISSIEEIGYAISKELKQAGYTIK